MSRQLTESGELNVEDREMVATLKRRRDYLADEIATTFDEEVRGVSYDRREVAALNWTLDLIRTIQERGGLRDGRDSSEAV